MPETVVLYKIVYHGVKCACVRREGIGKMKNKISRRSFLAAAAVSAAALVVSGCDAKTSKKEVTDITVWNYYNGDQLESFNRLVSTFNETIGKAKGIRVSSSSQGTVNDLEANVMDAAEGKVGSAEMPTILPPTRIPLISWTRWAWW